MELNGGRARARTHHHFPVQTPVFHYLHFLDTLDVEFLLQVPLLLPIMYYFIILLLNFRTML